MKTKGTHGGKRKGAGRKRTSELPVHIKKFRATDDEWKEFLSMLKGDARMDLILVLAALRAVKK